MKKRIVWTLLLSVFTFFALQLNSNNKNDVYAEIKASEIKPLCTDEFNLYPVFDSSHPLPTGVKFYSKSGSNYNEITATMDELGQAANKYSKTIYYYNPTTSNINCFTAVSTSYNTIFSSGGGFTSNFENNYGDYDVYTDSNCKNWDKSSKNDSPTVYGIELGTILNAYGYYESSFLTSASYNSNACYVYKASNGTWGTANKADSAMKTVFVCTFGVTVEYKLTYDGNNNTSGSVPTDDTKYNLSVNATVQGNTGSLARTGYTFAGWNTKSDGSGTNYSAGSSFTLSGDTTLYARWFKNVDIDETSQSKTYSGSNIEFELKGNDKDAGSFDIQYKLNGSNDSTYTSTKPINVGSYDVKITRNADNTYAAYSKVISNGLVINKLEVEKPTQSTSLTYNGSSQSPTFTSSDYINVSGSVSETNAGTYNVTFALKDKDNTWWKDNTVSDVEGTWKIDKKIIKASDITFTNNEYTFDGQKHGPSGTINTGVLCGSDTCSVTVDQFTNGGTYTPLVSISNINYVLENNRCATLTINPVDITSTITFTNLVFRYDGNTHLPTVSSPLLVDGYPCNAVFEGSSSEIGKHTATLTGFNSINYAYSANPNKTVEYTIIPVYEVVFLTGDATGDVPTIEGDYIVGDEITLPYYCGGLTYNEKSFVGWNSDKTATTGYSGEYTITQSDFDDDFEVFIFYPVFVDGTHNCHDKIFNVILNNCNSDHLSSGYYYLNDYLKLEESLIIDSTEVVHICLNGQVLDLGARNIQNNGTLYIYDCCNDEYHYHYFDYDEDDKIWVLNEENTESKRFVKGGVIYNGYTAINSSAKLEVNGVNFVGNRDSAISHSSISDDLNVKNCIFLSNVSRNGGAIAVNSNANIYNSTFKYNRAIDWGGAICFSYGEQGDTYVAFKGLLSDCIFEENEAGIGGAIYIRNYILTLSNTSITNNIATSTAGGLYTAYDPEACLTSGTIITMANGTYKNIEDIEVGDYVKTFDHLTNEYVSSMVYLVYKSDTKEHYFTLNFESGSSLNIVGLHSLFNKEENKYVRLSMDNVSSYIGKHFYNATSKSWDKLTSYAYSTDKKEYYSIYTESTFNVISNNLLSLSSDTDFEYEIFEFNNDLSINTNKLNEDINKYGLLEFEDCVYVTDYDVYKRFNLQYYYIWLGKDNQKAKNAIDSYKKLYCTPLMVFANLNAAQLITYDTYGSVIEDKSGDTVETWIVVCDGTVIKDNKVKNDSEDFISNIEFQIDSNSSENTGTNLMVVGTKDVDIGIHNSTSYLTSIDTTETDYRKYIKNDNEGYAVFTRYDEDNEVYYYANEQGYIVKYDSNTGSGTEIVDSWVYDDGESVTFKTNTYTKEGYKFVGWRLNKDSGDVLSSYTISATDATNYVITLYAVWEKAYKVSYNNLYQTITGTLPTDTNSYCIGETITIKSSLDLVRPNFIYKGFSLTTNASSGETSIVLTSDMIDASTSTIILYSAWLAKEDVGINLSKIYRVFYTGSAIVPSIEYSKTDVLATSFTYEFMDTSYGVLGSVTNPGQYYLHVTRAEDDTYQSVDVKLNYIVNYKVTFKANGGVGNDYVYDKDGVNVISDSQGIDTVKVNPGFTLENYTLSSWNTKADGTGTSYALTLATIFPTSNMDIYAIYTPTISTQPSVTNDFEVVPAVSTVTYQWEKSVVIEDTESELKVNNVAIGTSNIASNNKNITIICIGNASFVKFKSTVDLDGYTKDSDGYYSVAFITFKARFAPITNTSSEFEIYDIKAYTKSYVVVNNETSSKMVNANENCTYRCKITSTIYNTSLYSDEISTIAISFSCNETTTGSLPSTIYALENRVVTVPSCSLVRTNYKLAGWNSSSGQSSALSSITATSGLILYPVWTNKDVVSFTTTSISTYTYGDSNIKYVVKGSDLSNFIIEYCIFGNWYNTIPSDAGSYDVRVSRNEDNDYASLSQTIITNGLVINKAKVNEPSVTGTYTYTGQPITVVLNGVESYMTTTNSLTNTDADIYLATFTLDDNHEWNSGNDGIISWIIEKAKVNEPSVNGSYVYNGLEQTVVLSGVESYMTTFDSLSHTNPDIYTITYTLDNNHTWDIGSDGIISWEIKASSIKPKDENTSNTIKVDNANGFSKDIEVIVKVVLEANVSESINSNILTNYNLFSEDNIKLKSNEKVGVVYDVKLYQVINNEYTEIQPSYFGDNSNIAVKMLLPTNLDINKVSRILHVHSPTDVTSINFDKSNIDADGYYVINVDKLSEFVFVYEEDAPNTNNNFLLVLIIIVAIILLFIIQFVIWKIEYNKAFKRDSLDDRKLSFLDFINLPINNIFDK